MSKIVQAINSMIANPHFITDVMKGEAEIFFLYKGRYKWSMKKIDDEYFLYYYPDDESLEHIMVRGQMSWDNVNMIFYRSDDIGTREAEASFSELYTVLTEKLHGVDKVLDDIISDLD